MVHLTNDYRKLLRKNGPKAALSLCVALALSGGLVSAEGKTYADVSPWGSREALEGDPIEVEWMRGGEGTLQAGTDETGNVRIHHLKTWGNPDTYAYVKGKKITIEDRDPSDPTANWGGKMYIGGDTTESVTMKGLHAGNQSETTIYGRAILMGTLGTGDGQFTIGNKNTESVTINDFEAAKGSSTSINGHSVSMGSLNNWGGTVTVKTDGDFKVAKDGNTQDIGVTGSGTLSVTAGSVEAGRLNVSGIFNPITKESHPSKINFHAADKKGIYLSGGLFASSRADVLMDSNIVQLDSRSETDSYGGKVSDSINSTDSTISIGRDGSQITLNGRLFNAGSNVTLNGRSIHISAVQADDDGVIRGKSVEAHGDSVTYIGNKSTRMVDIDGKTNTSGNAVLAIHGRNISLSYAKGIALSGYGGGNKGEISIGGSETDSLTITGQVSSQGINRLNLSGEHITVDSTGYDGSESTQFPFSESLVTPQNNIDVGDKNTKTIFISSGLSARNGNINVMGKEIAIGASSYFNTHEIKSWDGSLRTDGYIAYADEGNINVGSENSDTVALSGGRLLADSKDITVKGHHISLDGKQQWAGQTNGGNLTIGSQNSDSVFIQGKGGIHALGGEADIKGKQISIHSDVQNALENAGAPIHVGDSGTQSVDISGGIVSHGSNISIMGRDISISKGKQENAIYTDGGTVSIITTGDKEAHISGPIVNDYGAINLSFAGASSCLITSAVNDNAFGKPFIYKDKVWNEEYLVGLDGELLKDKSGRPLNVKNVTTIPDEARQGIRLSLNNKAAWYTSADSRIYSYDGNNGNICLDDYKAQPTIVTVSKFKDKDTRIHEDIYGSGNTGNDTIHIDNSYTGHTHFWLVNREGTDKGVVGTVLASALKKDAVSTGNASGAKALMMMAAKPMAAPASNPIADFQADHFKAFGMNSLYFKTYGLGVKDSEGDTADYTKDLYITGVTNHTTNEHGQYTPTVSTALSGSSLMYYTWRTENDKMLQRVGDLRENEGEETGLWARIRGSRIGKSHSDRGFKNQYKVYEIGYDAKTEDNDRMKSFTGIAFSYLDGKGYYTDGRGTNQAASAAIYHTDIHKTGHYLDLVFRIRHMNERLHTHTTVDADIGPITEDHSASMDTTGLSFSAEYGRKKFVGNGWYVEPQTQWTLGYLGPNQYEMDNGTRVEQPGITSFVGRVGFNLGRQVNPNSIVYLKANVYHEFGGHSPIHLYAGDESLSFTDTFDDTWFEYGVGFAMKLGSRLSLYGDFEKSAGSHFYKDWQWNAGIRYSF